MQLKAPSPRQDSEENVLPLINIVFLLLIFFMLAGTIKAPDLFPVQLPESNAEQTADKAPPQLLISATGEFAIDQEILDPSEVAAAIQAKLAADNSSMLIIKADMSTPATTLLKVVNDLSDIDDLRLTLLADRI